MLIKDYEHIFNVMCIDPGINHLGLCILSIDFLKLKILNTNSFTIHVKENQLNKSTIEYYGLRQAKIDYLNILVRDNLILYSPVTLALESPFYNMARPAAFMPLVELLYQLKQTLRSLNDIVNFELYPPSIVKKTVGASAVCKKEEVRDYVLKLTDQLHYSGETPIEDLDEHSIDALAVAYTHFKLGILGNHQSKK
jgi:Holliday junction resolvasome RuvABC endonuclease subunit